MKAFYTLVKMGASQTVWLHCSIWGKQIGERCLQPFAEGNIGGGDSKGEKQFGNQNTDVNKPKE